MYVITPEDEFTLHTYRSDDFMAYFRLVRANVLEIVDRNETDIPTYPNPVRIAKSVAGGPTATGNDDKMTTCRWWRAWEIARPQN